MIQLLPSAVTLDHHKDKYHQFCVTKFFFILCGLLWKHDTGYLLVRLRVA